MFCKAKSAKKQKKNLRRNFRPLPNKNVPIWDHFFPLLFPKDSECLKIFDIQIGEVGAKRRLNSTLKVNRHTDIRTHGRTFRLIESTGPEGGTSKVNRQTKRQKDRQTDRQTFRLIESIGPLWKVIAGTICTLWEICDSYMQDFFSHDLITVPLAKLPFKLIWSMYVIQGKKIFNNCWFLWYD